MPHALGPASNLAFALALVGFLALAGCSGAPAADPAPGAATESITSSTTSSTAPAPLPAGDRTQAIDWNETLGAGVWACDGTVTHDCTEQPEGAFGKSTALQGFSGNLTAGSVVLSWTAASAVTSELVLEVHVLPACDGCDILTVSHQGPSPVTVDLPVGVALGPEDELTLSVYSNKYVAQPAAAAGASGDQPFRVTGTMTLA